MRTRMYGGVRGRKTKKVGRNSKSLFSSYSINFSVTKNVTKIVARPNFHSKKMQVESGEIL